jgi:glycosyltransferase involved in cell wall biosynthesis
MLLINVSNLEWVPERLKRNQAIFTYLLRTGTFDAGAYIAPSKVHNISTNQEWRLPFAKSMGAVEDGAAKVFEPVFTLPLTWREPILSKSAKCIAASLRKQFIQDRPYVLWMNSISPLAVALSAQLAANAKLRIFDSSDDFVAFEEPGPKQDALTISLNRVLSLADRVLCVNQHVHDILPHRQKLVFSNCTDFQNFHRPQSAFTMPTLFPKVPGKRYIGFSGGLNRIRVDLDLLKRLFLQFPDDQFIFVGYTNDPALNDWLRGFPNTAFIPEVPYTVLPSIIRSFDVAIVPHLDNENTRGNDLLKILDYFASGVPVVTTRCSDVDQYAGACVIADDHQSFVDAIDGILKGSLAVNTSLAATIAKSRTWEMHVPTLLPWLKQPTAPYWSGEIVQDMQRPTTADLVRRNNRL